jgi:hypothetical protein
VSVAQLVELLVVVQVVAGSSPVAHPSRKPCNAALSLLKRLAGGERRGANEVPNCRRPVAAGSLGRRY